MRSKEKSCRHTGEPRLLSEKYAQNTNLQFSDSPKNDLKQYRRFFSAAILSKKSIRKFQLVPIPVLDRKHDVQQGLVHFNTEKERSRYLHYCELHSGILSGMEDLAIAMSTDIYELLLKDF